MDQAVILSAVRTPIGKFQGGLAPLSATELGPAQQEALRARFVELTQHEVEFQFRLDRELLGGVRAQVDSTVYDGSVRGELERIRRQLTAH